MLADSSSRGRGSSCFSSCSTGPISKRSSNLSSNFQGLDSLHVSVRKIEEIPEGIAGIARATEQTTPPFLNSLPGQQLCLPKEAYQLYCSEIAPLVSDTDDEIEDNCSDSGYNGALPFTAGLDDDEDASATTLEVVLRQQKPASRFCSILMQHVCLLGALEDLLDLELLFKRGVPLRSAASLSHDCHSLK